VNPAVRVFYKMKKRKVKNRSSEKDKIRDEYYLLTDKLDEINWALEGSCDDIDCDKYTYKDLLKKKYKPILEHNYSCMNHLKLKKEAIMRILSLKRYRKERITQCEVCKDELDKLGKTFTIVSFTRPSNDDKRFPKSVEVKLIDVHKKCKKKIRIPEGWRKSR